MKELERENRELRRANTILRKAREAEPSRGPPRAQRDAFFAAEIQRVWGDNQRVYGARKVWLQLRQEGFVIARYTLPA